MCGTESAEMVFKATYDEQTFEWDQLRRYDGLAGESDRFDACTYTFIAQPRDPLELGTLQV